MILKSIFTRSKPGFYVDVGAYDPQMMSNTHHFYLQGWRGINIDPNPKSIEEFNKLRTRDINLELAISNSLEEHTFYVCGAPSALLHNSCLRQEAA
jgi:hypothetical protein